MKKYALLLAMVFSVPAFADSALCDGNLQQINDFLKTANPNATGVKVNAVHEYLAKAEEAKKAGNYEECVNQSSQALRVIKKPANR
ncbi:hypothetical protein N5J43_08850 [Pseudomonas nicosulfuronedens]|uniref:Uncharacterized protein n=1 Tax=Pseudomonas nicosulfuronedens TaxID=2571105 RepID=A0A5R9R3P8_9PSED|nr:hypothetical protein [Pseudomonas nicosulfuronedens]MDH1010759.1 hypothetical protein [Pseudomonas nicosulfuronedens]MDH1979057.1 hypothetical protein [Pseudomonas nicosulfuronedens]MDH2025958.1 hypothetical protein [Pseudomonas nicosulfuronedens]TLX77300.1 hypothetical protein FAS41_13365 [Pseudomonas nicosulfuronedens]